MKTLLKRFKYFAGLGFAALLLFSSFLTLIPQSPAIGSASAQINTPGGTPSLPCPTQSSCGPSQGNTNPNPAPVVSNGCAGTEAPAGYNCDTIPAGCPGSGSRYQSADPNANLNCPFDPTSTSSWTCPSTTCKLPSGTYEKGQRSSVQATDPNANDPELDCNTTETMLDWVICPVVKIVNSAINALDTQISGMLEVDPTNVDENSSSGGRYYQAWQSFRNIALGILVLGALFMIIGQALGFEMLDAYTVKKVLPRLIVAIIGISLSWEIMAWFVTFTNDLGFGIREVIYWPFRGVGDGTITGGGEGVLVSLLAAPALLAAGIYTLLLFAGTAFLGLVVVFLVLTLRQLVIVVLILLAPIAIACYILPNTQGIWKIWYESFTKALMMFPIIMAFLAVGRIFAQVSSDRNATTVDEIIAFLAYILPYFLIPLTFRFAGGALRTVGGFVNDRSRGGFDRLKKARQGNWEKRKEGAANGTLWANKGLRGRAMTLTQGAAAAKKTRLGANPANWKGRIQRQMENRDELEAAEWLEKSEEAQPIKANDDTLVASRVKENYLDQGKTKKWIMANMPHYTEQEAEQMSADIVAAQRAVSKDVFMRATLKALPSTGTWAKLKVNEETGVVEEGGIGMMHEEINKTYGDDRIGAARALASLRSSAERAQRPDLVAGSFSQQLAILNKQYDEKSGLNAEAASTMGLDATIETNGAYPLANARTGTVEAIATRMHVKLRMENQKRLQARQSIMAMNIDDREKEIMIEQVERPYIREIAKATAFYEEAGRTSPEKANAIASRLTSQMITDEDNNEVNVQQVIEQMRNNPIFQQYRKEFASAGRTIRRPGINATPEEIAEYERLQQEERRRAEEAQN